MILVSTGTKPKQSAYQTVLEYKAAGIEAMELSGGLYVADDLQHLLEQRKQVNLFVHNYFPPADPPFVFNLASLDKDVAEESIAHAKKSIVLSTELGNPIYSFHAGYLINPKSDELGSLIKKRELFDRTESRECFIERICELSQFAEQQGVQLLIENNVISRDNFKHFGCDPLLMTTPSEAREIMTKTPQNVNLLIDVAHLKVSAKTLDYNPEEMFSACNNWIRAYHLSDNDGTADTNDAIDENAWFWPYIVPKAMFYSLEIKALSPKELKEQVCLVENMLVYNR